MKDNRKRPKGRTARILGILFVLWLLSPILGLIAFPFATRWLLSGPKLRALINAQPQFLLLDYDEAVSRWPGKLTIKGLRIRGSDPNVQYVIRLENAEIEYSVLALIRKTFKVQSLKGSGLAFALRNKLEPAAAKKADTSVLPEIPGFSDPPLRSPDDVPPPPDPKVWLVVVHGIAIDRFDDIWVDAYHFRGSARVDGSFVLRPALFAQVGPAKVTLASGAVRIGKSEEDIPIAGTVSATFDGFAPLEYPNSKVFEKTSAEIKLAGSFQKLEALQHLFQLYGRRLGAGVGKATIEGTIDHGIAKGSINAAINNAVVQLDKYRLQGDLELHVPFPRWNLVSGPIDVSGSRVVVSDTRVYGSTDPWRWAGRFDIPSGKIDVTTTATVEAKTQDARPLLAILGVDLPGWTKGLLTLKDFSGSARAVLGPSVVRIQDFDAKGDTYRIQGHYVREKGATDGAFLIESGILSVGVELDGKAATVRPFFAKQWFAKQGNGSGEAASRAGK